MAGLALHTLAAGLLSGLLSNVQLCPPDETGAQVPAPTMGNLQPSRACQATLPVFGHYACGYVAPDARLAMSNDGGWCWFAFTEMFRQAASVPAVSVTAPPSHGQAVIEISHGRIGVAYQPAPGFVGSDRFTVRTNGPIQHNIPVQVTVGQVAVGGR